MMICDRCKKEIKNVSSLDDIRIPLTIYTNRTSPNVYMVDLCPVCREELHLLMSKVESYFMIDTKKSCRIFDNIKYFRGED